MYRRVLIWSCGSDALKANDLVIWHTANEVQKGEKKQQQVFRTQNIHWLYINNTADLVNGEAMEQMWSLGDVGHMDNSNKSLDLAAKSLAVAEWRKTCDAVDKLVRNW